MRRGVSSAVRRRPPKLARRSQLGPMFVRPRGGVDRLTDVLAERVGERLRTHAAVTAIEPGRVVLETGESLEADVVVATTPAHETARMLDAVAPSVAADLAGIAYASTGVVLMVYPPGNAGGASRRHRVRRAARQGADDRRDVAQQQVAIRRVRGSGRRALLRRRRRRGRRARRRRSRDRRRVRAAPGGAW